MELTIGVGAFGDTGVRNGGVGGDEGFAETGTDD